MTNEILKDEILSEEELYFVNGGTVAELNDIWGALEKKTGTLGDVSNTLRTILDYLPGGAAGTALWRNAAAPLAEKALKDCFGIDSYISIGWLGTGIRESGNRYSKNGRGISHQEVLNIIDAA